MLMDRNLPTISDDTDRMIALMRMAGLAGATVGTEAEVESIALAHAVALYDAMNRAAGTASNDNRPSKQY